MNTEQKQVKNFHYAWVILFVASLVLGVYVPIVNSLSNSWQLAVTQDLGFSRTAFSLTGTITQAVGIFLGPVMSYFLTKYNFKRIWTLGGLATSIAVSGISAGGALLSPLISSLIGNFGWRASYRVYALIILALGLVFGLFLIYLKPEDKGLKPYGYREGGPEKIDLTKDSDRSLNVGLTIAASLSASFFIFLLLGSVLNGLANGASLQFPPALQGAAGFQVAAKVMSIYLLLGVFGKLLLGRIADKQGIHHALAFGAGTLALSFVVILFVEKSWGPWLFSIVFGFGLALGSVLPPLVTSTIYNREMYGEAYGFVQSATQVGAAFGPLLVSYIYDAQGSYQWAWVINIVFACLTGIFWFLAHQGAKKYANGARA